MNILDALSAAVDKAGSQTKFGALHGISVGYINDVLMKRRPAGPKILAALGLEKTYKKAVKS